MSLAPVPQAPPPAAQRILAYGPKVLILGDGGTGKSHVLRTALEVPGQEVCVIMTEPSGMETLEDTPHDRMHWQYIAPAAANWDMLLASSKLINNSSIKTLAEMGDIDKRKFPQWIEFIGACANFTCDRCGKIFGPLDKLPPNVMAAYDSLSGMNEMAMNLVVGMKPMRSMADWGIAMNNMERFIIAASTSIPTMLVITGHLEREQDEVTQTTTITASSLGKKLGPKIGRYFSDIIMARREGTKFEWSTGAFNVALKARNVPISDHIPASLKPLIEKWHARIGFKPAQ